MHPIPPAFVRGRRAARSGPNVPVVPALGARTVAGMRRALVVLFLVFAACGADSGSGDAANRFTVVGTEMAFDAPDSVAAGDYEVTFRNDGAVHHELAFRNPEGEFRGRRSIAGGQSVVMKVTLAPGTWELGCFEPGHYEAGMHKPLEVT